MKILACCMLLVSGLFPFPNSIDTIRNLVITSASRLFDALSFSQAHTTVMDRCHRALYFAFGTPFACIFAMIYFSW
jgi:hypothetical protein